MLEVLESNFCAALCAGSVSSTPSGALETFQLRTTVLPDSTCSESARCLAPSSSFGAPVKLSMLGPAAAVVVGDGGGVPGAVVVALGAVVVVLGAVVVALGAVVVVLGAVVVALGAVVVVLGAVVVALGVVVVVLGAVVVALGAVVVALGAVVVALGAVVVALGAVVVAGGALLVVVGVSDASSGFFARFLANGGPPPCGVDSQISWKER